MSCHPKQTPRTRRLRSPDRVLRRAIRHSLFAVLTVAGLLTAVPAAAQEIELGLGYDRARDGHGYELHRAGDLLVLYFYTFDRNGNPEWFLGLAEFDNGVLFGDLQRFTYSGSGQDALVVDPDFDGEFRLDYVEGPASPACNDGTARFDAEQLAAFYWRTGEESGTWCTEFLRTGSDFASDPYHGGVWYAGESDPGYGVTMSHMDVTETALVYYYDNDGNPRWALGAGRENDASIVVTHYNGYCRSCTPRNLDAIDAGFFAVDWSPVSEPGRGGDRAEINVSYPNPPGGTFRRDFTMRRLSDGRRMAQYAVAFALDTRERARFVAAWEEFRFDGGDADIRGQALDSQSPDPVLNADRTRDQGEPSLGVAADGSHVVVWEDDVDGNGSYQVWARGFNADGSERFPRITVNSEGSGQQRNPAVAVAPNGNFVVVWEDDQDGNGFTQIMARGFSAGGGERIPDFTVNNEGGGSQLAPVIAMDAGGSFVVAWRDDQDVNGLFDVAMRSFNASGGALGGQLRVNTSTGGNRRDVALDVSDSGDFVVAWADDRDLNGFYEIYGRGFRPGGSERFSERSLNSTRTASQYQPAVGMLPGGDFIVAWIDQGYRVMARGFDIGGGERWGERVLNARPGSYVSHPAIAVNRNGSSVVAWSYVREGAGLRLRGRPLDRNGVAGAEILISRDNIGPATEPVIAAY